jgi:probable rRNA maturation factor
VSIRIYYDEITFRVKNWRKIKKVIEKVIANENKISGDLNFILTSDSELKKINTEFLNHNYFTDVICFDYGEEKIVSGEIYISADTVRSNAKNYKVSYNNETLRVIIHGVLHLCGHNDKTYEERSEMRNQEDYWLDIFEKM